jgi:AraC-like DNA-binding protein
MNPQSILPTNNRIGSTVTCNPFECHLRLPDKHGLSKDVFDAPLPLSSARQDLDRLFGFDRLFHMVWPCFQLIALEGSAITTDLVRRNWISLLFVAMGEVTLEQQNSLFTCQSGDCLFIPEDPAVWHSTRYSIVCLMFARPQLLAALHSLRSQEPGWKSSSESDLATPVCRKKSDGSLESSLLEVLHHLLSSASELASSHPILLTRLGILNQLSLLTALLASPSLRHPLVADSSESNDEGVNGAIDELTAYMLTHLGEPLNLSQLEKHSHYSRRSLQYAFREKFGCTITQWIRSQRLDLAYEQLKSGASDSTVKSIANACGYRSISLFSINFQNRFHVKPSTLLRRHKGE